MEPWELTQQMESRGWGPRDSNRIPGMGLAVAASPPDPAWAHRLTSLAKLLCCRRESQGNRRGGCQEPFLPDFLWS